LVSIFAISCGSIHFAKASFLSFSKCFSKILADHLLALKKKSAISHNNGIAQINKSAD
jgi:hypothetical protein